MAPKDKVAYSFPNLKYPSLRDHQWKTIEMWLEGKALDDGAEGLWRVHDGLYDLEKYIKKHPGGAQWLNLTRNTDITEHFESHHITTLPERILKQFYVRDAKTKRNSPFTFKDDGFYRTLKTRVRPELDKIPKSLNWKSKRLLEALLFTMFSLSVSIFYINSSFLRFATAFLAAVAMAYTVICAHNFIHQKDSWRMYAINFSFITVRHMRIAHSISNHMYPNTLMDLEVSIIEPFFEYMVWKTKTRNLLRMIIHTPINYLVFWDLAFLTNVYTNLKGTMPFSKQQLIPFTLLLAMYLFGSRDLWSAFEWWTIIMHLGSFVFSAISFSSGHHHPDVFHEGDEPRSEQIDWGIHQVECMIERAEAQNSILKGLTHYGDHALHHLFPTLDHSRLQALYPLVEKTCKEFGTGVRASSQIELLMGQLKQMVKVQPVKKNGKTL